MTLALGCIADDYTGASDLANTLTRAGLRTVQTIGVPADDLALPEVDAVVVSLKSRSIEAGLAVTRSRAAEAWLRGRGAGHILFKICSTFDSTDAGNIGPVMDALRSDSKDNIVLVYNKEMFDQAGVAYPDENWTWDDMMDASAKIYAATGKYGYMAYNDEQLGYWNFVYQNGGYILDPETNTHAGYTQPATADAIKYYVDIQKNEWCPNQAYFAETTPGTAFFSQQGAMFFEGSWNLLSSMKNYPDLVGKWDIAMLPACPNPASGSGRASISNGLCYATAAKGKNLEIVKDVLRFFGSEEGQRVQGESGAAIPAYLGLEDTWSTKFYEFDYMLDVQQCYDQFDYVVQYINNATRRKWKSAVADEMVRVYNGSNIDESLAKMQAIADSYVTQD